MKKKKKNHKLINRFLKTVLFLNDIIQKIYIMAYTVIEKALGTSCYQTLSK